MQKDAGPVAKEGEGDELEEDEHKVDEKRGGGKVVRGMNGSSFFSSFFIT